MADKISQLISQELNIPLHHSLPNSFSTSTQIKPIWGTALQKGIINIRIRMER